MIGLRCTLLGEECSLSQFLETKVHLLVRVKSSSYSVFVAL